MNLERLDEMCLSYLSQAANPLVPAAALLAFCRRDEECSQISEKGLLEFLRGHELFLVVAGPQEDDPINTEVFRTAGLDMGPRVILKTRIPPPKEISAMMQEQLDTMTTALSALLVQAESLGDPAGLESIRGALQRAEALRAKLCSMLR